MILLLAQKAAIIFPLASGGVSNILSLKPDEIADSVKSVEGFTIMNLHARDLAADVRHAPIQIALSLSHSAMSGDEIPIHAESPVAKADSASFQVTE
jgi:hypothetical protein